MRLDQSMSCPACEQELRSALFVAAPERALKANDVAICVSCRTMLIVEAGGRFRLPVEGEVSRIAEAYPRGQEKIDLARQMVAGFPAMRRN